MFHFNFFFVIRLNAFLEGFYDIIPKRLISIFNEQELELLISGLPNVDIEDLKSNTEYHKYQANSIQVSGHNMCAGISVGVILVTCKTPLRLQLCFNSFSH